MQNKYITYTYTYIYKIQLTIILHFKFFRVYLMFVPVKKYEEKPITKQLTKKKQFQNLHLKLPIVFKFKFTRCRINPK